MKKDYLLLLKRRLPFFAAALFAYILNALAFSFPEITESLYSRAVYPFFANIFSFIFGGLPFSVSEFLLYAFILFAIISVILIPLSFFKRQKRLFTFVNRILSLICALACVYSCFVLNWSLNYARHPLSVSMGLNTEKYSAEELYTATCALADKANYYRASCSQDANGVFTTQKNYDELCDSIVNAYKNCDTPLLNPVSSGARVKPVTAKNLLSTFETTGIFSPFTYEANYNAQMPEAYLISTCAHEYTHLQGFAREDEACFIAWYVLRNTDDVELNYSAYIYALNYALNSLYSADKELYSDAYRSIDEAVLRDIRNNGEYWAQFDTKLSEEASEVYSDYLQASGVQDGLKSYGRMLDLILSMQKMGIVL